MPSLSADISTQTTSSQFHLQTQNTLISSVSATAYDTLAPKHVLNNRIRAQMGIDFGILENGIIKIPIQSDIADTEFKTNESAAVSTDFGILENGIIKIPIQSDIAVTEFKTNKSEVVSTGAGVCWYVCRHKIRGLALPSSHDDG